MKYQKRPPLTSREIQVLILIAVVTVAVLATLIGLDLRLSSALPGGGGFFSAWEGSRAFLFRSADPYSGAVASHTQGMVYGRPARPGENPYVLDIPFFLLPIYFPLAFISDPATARGLWLFLDEVALVGMTFLALRLIEWRPTRLFHFGYALLSVIGLYSVLSQVDGGPAILLGLLYPALLMAYADGLDELAGAFLVLTLFAWEIGLLFVVLILWKVVYDKRWRVLAGFAMTLLILFVVSLVTYPGWLFPFLISTVAMLRASFGITSAGILLRLFPAYGIQAGRALTILLILLLLYEWAATRGRDYRRFIWAASLTLAVTPLLGLRTDPGNFVVFLPGLALIFAAIANRWRSGYWLASLLLLIAILLPWGLFVRWYFLHEQRAYDYLVLFFPLFTMAGLYWTRWWFIRPPRTWFDHVRSTLNPATRPATSKRSLNSLGWF